MARNGSGTFVTPNTFVAGTTITAADHNENWTDAAAEITNSLALDGQSAMTAPLLLANGSSATPAASFDSDPDVGMYRDSANILGLAASQGVLLSPYGGFKVTVGGSDITGLTAGSYNKIHFNTEDLDTAGIYDSATNFRYTPLKSGWYYIHVSIKASGNIAVDDQPQAIIYKNGSIAVSGTYIPLAITNPATVTSVVTGLIQLNGTTDYVEGFVYLPTGVTVLAGDLDTTFMFGWRAL